jgi:hypothetical protein
VTGTDSTDGTATSPTDPSTEEIPVVEQVAAATRTAVPDPVGAPRTALVAGSTLGGTDAEAVAARALGDAGSLRGQRLDPRRALTAAVAAVWGAALVVTALFAATALYRVAPDVPRWLVAVGGVVCVVAAVLLLSDLDPASAVASQTAGYDSATVSGGGVAAAETGDVEVTEPTDPSRESGRHDLGVSSRETAGESDDFHELDWNRRELYSLRPVDVAWAAVELAPLFVFVAVTLTGVM